MWSIPQHMTSAVVDGLRNEAHQADAAASVDEIDVSLHLETEERRRGGAEIKDRKKTSTN